MSSVGVWLIIWVDNWASIANGGTVIGDGVIGSTAAMVACGAGADVGRGD